SEVMVVSSPSPLTVCDRPVAQLARHYYLRMTIGILGGTGPQGRGLTHRLAAAGHPVAINLRYQAHSSVLITDLP
ncbi:MAG TPA: hypothetical protein VNT27_04385, partial [Propionibacteriaceae bacterium]|nr:hypothetical protein [Propionibacteriaceae bacterium]